MKKYAAILLAIAMSFTACMTLDQKQEKLVRQGAYAVSDSIHKGRIDLAVKYSDQVTRVIPPPKLEDRIQIQPFMTDPPKAVVVKPAAKTPGSIAVVEPKTGKTSWVVLPSFLGGYQVVVEDSPQYKQLLSENKELASQVNKEKAKYDDYVKEADKLLDAREKAWKDAQTELARVRASKHRWQLFGWTFGLGTVGLIAGAIALTIFCPGALTMILTLVRTVSSNLFGALRKFIGSFKKDPNV